MKQRVANGRKGSEREEEEARGRNGNQKEAN